VSEFQPICLLLVSTFKDKVYFRVFQGFLVGGGGGAARARGAAAGLGGGVVW
jgi:hypothetical protein